MLAQYVFSNCFRYGQHKKWCSVVELTGLSNATSLQQSWMYVHSLRQSKYNDDKVLLKLKYSSSGPTITAESKRFSLGHRYSFSISLSHTIVKTKKYHTYHKPFNLACPHSKSISQRYDRCVLRSGSSGDRGEGASRPGAPPNSYQIRVAISTTSSQTLQIATNQGSYINHQLSDPLNMLLA